VTAMMRGVMLLAVLAAISMGGEEGMAAAPADASVNAYIQDWLVCGPFPNPRGENPDGSITRQGFDVDYLASVGGEAGCRPKPGMAVTVEGRTYTFERRRQDEPTLDFLKVFDETTLRVAYAYAVIDSDADQQAFLHLGSDDGVKVWLNGDLMDEVRADRACREHDDIVAVRLKQGSNALLAKVDQGGGGWGLVVQVLDRQGHRDYLREQMQTQLGIAVSYDGDLGRLLTVRPDPRVPVGDVLDETPVLWKALDEDGEAVAEGEGSFGAPVRLELPARRGFYSVQMRIPELGIDQRAFCLLADDRAAEYERILAKARAVVGRPGNARYAGWVAYLLGLAETAMDRKGAGSTDCAGAARRLDDWLGRIRRDPLPEMRGGFEWAYLSRADGTGQPFSLFVPDDYDPDARWPLRVNLHGMSGTHSMWVTLGQGHPQDYFELHVMGRARGGGYVGLCEVDVLEAIEYVRANWNIDPDRVHLGGGSMGGGGTFFVASRRPDLFASAFPQCGFGAHVRIENLLHVPVFSVHSDDDPTVPVVLSRLPVSELVKSGGRAIQYETTGFGHAVHMWQAGFERAHDWERRQVRPAVVDRVRYTATDALARGAYWAQIVEWGPSAKPARLDVQIGADNAVYAELANVGILSVDLNGAPADRREPMAVAVNGKLVTTLAPPLPRTLYIAATEDGWRVDERAPAAPAARRHFPGGAPLLYQGEPLMIVWGTQGDEATTACLREQARLARRFPRPGWREEDEEFPMYMTLFGRMPAKADVDVTRKDMEEHNLLLLGTAAENSVVARIADDLPVTVAGGEVRTSDGAAYAFDGCAMSLLYYNPAAPGRLVLWVASSDPVKMDAGRAAVSRDSYPGAACDFVLVRDDPEALVAQRNFAPDWAWEAGYLDSPLLSDDLCTDEGMAGATAKALRTATGCDYALLWGDWAKGVHSVAGTTRWADLTAMPAELPCAVVTLTAGELKRLAEAVADRSGSSDGGPRLFPALGAADVPEGGDSRIVLRTGWDVSGVWRLLGTSIERTELARVTPSQALAQTVIRPASD
jgi:hypothetical protein